MRIPAKECVKTRVGWLGRTRNPSDNQFLDDRTQRRQLSPDMFRNRADLRILHGDDGAQPGAGLQRASRQNDRAVVCPDPSPLGLRADARVLRGELSGSVFLPGPAESDGSFIGAAKGYGGGSVRGRLPQALIGETPP